MDKAAAFSQSVRVKEMSQTKSDGSKSLPESLAIAQEAKSVRGAPPFEKSKVVEGRCQELFAGILLWARSEASGNNIAKLSAVEAGMVKRLFELGRLLLLLFLTCAEEALAARTPPVLIERGRAYARNPRAPRLIGTHFGKVWFWRFYMYSAPRGDRPRGHGFFPLDRVLGLTRDGFSWGVINLALRLAVDMPFERTTETMTRFLGWSPAVRTIEELVLGVGAHAHQFQAIAPPPEGDGDILVTQFDSKGIPTATELELRRRRQKRRPNPHPESKRHRGRQKRRKAGPKKRRAPGDKSKNAKMGTLVVMYTLRRETGADGQPKLVGPLNIRRYSSFAPKRYAFEVARREAIKRGFGPNSGKLIQFVSDGDEDLDTYMKEYFGDYPTSKIVKTLDLPHVMEYVWSAGGALLAEGSGVLSAWAAKQKKRLLDGRVDLLLAELKSALDAIPKTGPGNKGRRERLAKAIRYIDTNIERMNYRSVVEQDLELASGAVEGAVKNTMGYRFDNGGMRWIRERAEALLQLRCIALNGQWEAFMAWLERELDVETGPRARLRRRHPASLPKVSSNRPRKAA